MPASTSRHVTSLPIGTRVWLREQWRHSFPRFIWNIVVKSQGIIKKSSHSSLSLEGVCLRKNLWFCYSYTELKILFRKQMFLNSQPFNVYGFSFKRSVLTVTALYVLNSCCWIIILYDLLIFYWLSLANPFLVWAAKRKLKISNFPIVTDDIHNSLVAPLQLISFYDNRQQILLAWHF